VTPRPSRPEDAADEQAGAAGDAETVSIPSDEDATAQPPALASEAHILERVARELSASGVAGETHLVQLLYLAVTSRLLERPCSVAVKGPSAGGKSYLLEQVLALFPPEAFYLLSAMSERALAYDPEPLAHRMLVIFEAAGIGGDIASYLMRSLLSEGRINYLTVVKGKNGLEHRRIMREGPTGLITTTTAVSLHPENETRLLSLAVTDSPAQTQAIMLAYARGTPAPRDRRAWHDLQRWLADSVVDVVVPYAESLAQAIAPVAVRLRRDFPTLLTLLRAHALLHQLHRERDADGRVLANFDDYTTVRSLVTDLLADATERAVAPAVRETVRAVDDLTGEHDPLGEGVPATAVATQLQVDKSTALRRLRVAAYRGYVKNLESRPHRPGRYVLGDPLPDDVTLLPTTAALERLHGCSAAEGAADLVELDYPPSATDPDADPEESAPVTPWSVPEGSPR
jgi:hypothetical protein